MLFRRRYSKIRIMKIMMLKMIPSNLLASTIHLRLLALRPKSNTFSFHKCCQDASQRLLEWFATNTNMIKIMRTLMIMMMIMMMMFMIIPSNLLASTIHHSGCHGCHSGERQAGFIVPFIQKITTCLYGQLWSLRILNILLVVVTIRHEAVQV